jgi:hypothetical protein
LPSDLSKTEYGAQARIISKLNESIAEWRMRCDRAEKDAERFRAGYEFYMLIQKACQESPVVAGEFRRFLMTCKLVEDDAQPGLTAEYNSDQFGMDF